MEPFFLLIFGMLGCLLFLAGAVGYVWALTNWTLGPLVTAARQAPAPTRFLLSDLLWLMIQLQLAMALAAGAVPRDFPTKTRVWAAVFLGLPAAAFWYACLHVVAQAGIRGTFRRGAVFVVLVPGTVVAIVSLPILAMAVLSLSGARISQPYELEWTLVALMVSAAATFGMRWLARWAVGETAT